MVCIAGQLWHSSLHVDESFVRIEGSIQDTGNNRSSVVPSSLPVKQSRKLGVSFRSAGTAVVTKNKIVLLQFVEGPGQVLQLSPGCVATWPLDRDSNTCTWSGMVTQRGGRTVFKSQQCNALKPQCPQCQLL